jgi:hypothetical protein
MAVKDIVSTLKFVTLHCTKCVARSDFAVSVLLSVYDVTREKPKFYQLYGKSSKSRV